MSDQQSEQKEVAKKAIGLLDLTNLNDDCREADVIALCKRAQTPFGNTAAICIWKEFIPVAKKALEGTEIKIATVVNFPKGGTDTEAVLAEVSTAIENGTDEIDLVFPYEAFLAGDLDICIDQIARVRDACRTPILLKVIIETGRLVDEGAIYSASRLAIDCGADFVKTSTGKVEVNATPEVAKIMLRAIKDSGKGVGFKPAGGIKTVEDAAKYLDIAAGILGPEWASPNTMRFGASGVLDNLLAVLDGTNVKPNPTGY
ncbi:MAG: deoxyribose-phosphate aldolase [Salaquimonas sp.]